MEPAPPPPGPSSGPGPAQRASDTEREAAARALRDAGADGRLDVAEMEDRLSRLFAARTHPEIDGLLADLRGREALGAPPSVESALRTSRRHRRDRMLTILSENTRRGFWRPAARTQVITLMGDAVIDLREAELTAPTTELRVLTLMGTTQIDVPADVDVEVTKVTILSRHEVLTAAGRPSPGAPRLRIRLVSIMGVATVRWAQRPPPPRSDLYA